MFLICSRALIGVHICWIWTPPDVHAFSLVDISWSSLKHWKVSQIASLHRYNNPIVTPGSLWYMAFVWNIPKLVANGKSGPKSFSLGHSSIHLPNVFGISCVWKCPGLTQCCNLSLHCCGLHFANENTAYKYPLEPSAHFHLLLITSHLLSVIPNLSLPFTLFFDALSALLSFSYFSFPLISLFVLGGFFHVFSCQNTISSCSFPGMTPAASGFSFHFSHHSYFQPWCQEFALSITFPHPFFASSNGLFHQSLLNTHVQPLSPCHCDG